MLKDMPREELSEKYFDIYFIEKVNTYKKVAIREGIDEDEARLLFKKGGLSKYYAYVLKKKNDDPIADEEVNSITKKDIEIVKDLAEEYRWYAELKARYGKGREDLFKGRVFLEWWEEQKERCYYCKITQKELYKIVDTKRDGYLTLNKKQKRRTGTLEIDQKEPPKDKEGAYKNKDNLVLACPLCNNAKSNLIDKKGWKDFFALPMNKYYESILERPLKYKPV